MRIDLPLCSFKDCRKNFDNNCLATKGYREGCEYLINKNYSDLEEQGLLIELPKETDEGFVTYIFQGSVYVVKIENIGHVISKRKVLKFYHDFDEASAVLNSKPLSIDCLK